MFGRIFEMLKVERIITLDIHSREIENSFDTFIWRTPTRPIRPSSLCASSLISAIRTRCVAPDTGAISRNKFYAQALHCPLAMLYK